MLDLCVVDSIPLARNRGKHNSRAVQKAHVKHAGTPSFVGVSGIQQAMCRHPKSPCQAQCACMPDREHAPVRQRSGWSLPAAPVLPMHLLLSDPSDFHHCRSQKILSPQTFNQTPNSSKTICCTPPPPCACHHMQGGLACQNMSSTPRALSLPESKSAMSHTRCRPRSPLAGHLGGSGARRRISSGG